MRLTTVFIKAIATPKKYHDGRGLLLNVKPSLSKSWVFKYTLNKKNRSITSKGGFSFSDMAKKTQKKKKKGASRYSFRGMAKSTKKESVPTFNFRLKRRAKTTQDP